MTGRGEVLLLHSHLIHSPCKDTKAHEIDKRLVEIVSECFVGFSIHIIIIDRSSFLPAIRHIFVTQA